MKTTVSFAFDIPEEDWDKSSRELKAAYREAFDTLLGEDSTLDELLTNPHPWIRSYFAGPRGHAAQQAGR